MEKTFNIALKEFINRFFILPYTEQVVFGLLFSMLIWASMTDILENKVYNKMCLTYAVARLCISFIYPITAQTLIGGFVGALLLFLPAFLINTSHMAGDIKFAGVLGLWLGPIAIMIALVICTFTFIIISLVKKKGLHGVLPYAPFISFGCLCTILLQYVANLT